MSVFWTPWGVSEFPLLGKSSYEAGQPKKFCVDAAKTAYVSFMPSPVGEWDTRNFIACVAYGMLSHMIDAELGPRLLYAAIFGSCDSALTT